MAKHTEEGVHRTLQTEWPSVERREINHGLQFTLPEGTKINLFPSTGKVQVQGKDSAERKRAEQLLQSAAFPSIKWACWFIVHPILRPSIRSNPNLSRTRTRTRMKSAGSLRACPNHSGGKNQAAPRVAAYFRVSAESSATTGLCFSSSARFFISSGSAFGSNNIAPLVPLGPNSA